MREDRFSNKGLLKGLEPSLLVFTLFERDVRLCKADKGFCNIGVVLDKLPVKVGEPKEASHPLYRCWGLLFFNS